MKSSTANRGIPAGNPIANVFVIVVGAIAIGVSIVLGVVAFVVLGIIVSVLAAVVGLRMWWFKRRLHAQGLDGAGASSRPDPGGVIEGEYHVIDGDAEERRKP